jgi:hypothetical protein
MSQSEFPKIKIIDNLHKGDIGLWYDVQAYVNGHLIHHVCDYDKCNSFEEAIKFYFKTFYKKSDHILLITHHKFSAFYLKQICLAA